MCPRAWASRPLDRGASAFLHLRFATLLHFGLRLPSLSFPRRSVWSSLRNVPGRPAASSRPPARPEPLRGQCSAPLTPPPACAVLQAQGALQSGSQRTWVSGRRQELVHYRSWLVGRTDEAVKNVITGKAPRPSRKPKGIATPQM